MSLCPDSDRWLWGECHMPLCTDSDRWLWEECHMSLCSDSDGWIWGECHMSLYPDIRTVTGDYGENVTCHCIRTVTGDYGENVTCHCIGQWQAIMGENVTCRCVRTVTGDYRQNVQTAPWNTSVGQKIICTNRSDRLLGPLSPMVLYRGKAAGAWCNHSLSSSAEVKYEWSSLWRGQEQLNLFRGVHIVAKSACYLPVWRHISEWLPLEKFPWNLILGTSMKICRGNPDLVKIG